MIIGLTGQTGAGKSMVAEILKENGMFIINADIAAREVMRAGEPVLKELSKVFGKDILNEDGSLNRKLLASRAFSSPENTDKLNKITHPAITERVKNKISEAFKQGYETVVLDAPQLFESGEDKMCDKVVTVAAPIDVRLKRIMNRDNITEEEALLRINAQYPEEYYINKSDVVIRNYEPYDIGAEIKILFNL